MNNSTPSKRKNNDGLGPLKTTLWLGGIAATAIGTQLIAQMETTTTARSTASTTSYTVELDAVPTVIVPDASSLTTSGNTTTINPTDSEDAAASEETVQVTPASRPSFQPRASSRSSR